MIKNTNCKKCLFSEKATSQSPCQHNIIDYIKDIKTLSVDNEGYYSIREYVCKMGFDKNTYETNKDKISLEEIKQEITNRACIRYYLLMNITEISLEEMENLCDYLKTLKIKPVFVSFIMFKHDDDHKKVEILKKSIDHEFTWKVHGFIESMSIDDAIHVAIDTNYGKNNSHYLLIYDIKDILDLDNDINEINTSIMITQQPMHYGLKKTSENINTQTGIFLTFNNYQICRSIDKNILNALASIPDAVILKYGR